MLSRIRTFLLDLLFPASCIRCGTEGRWLCIGCAQTLPKTLQHDREVFSLFSYREPWVARAIRSVKYDGVAEVADLFGFLLANRWTHREECAPIVTAIPLYSRRERERGFNQSERIARAFAATCGNQYVELLERFRPTETQTALSAADRMLNMQNAFRMHRTLLPLDEREKLVLSSRNVILIDDVVTTGATLHEAADVLQQYGFSTVLKMTVANEPLEKK